MHAAVGSGGGGAVGRGNSVRLGSLLPDTPDSADVSSCTAVCAESDWSGGRGPVIEDIAVVGLAGLLLQERRKLATLRRRQKRDETTADAARVAARWAGRESSRLRAERARQPPKWWGEGS